MSAKNDTFQEGDTGVERAPGRVHAEMAARWRALESPRHLRLGDHSQSLIPRHASVDLHGSVSFAIHRLSSEAPLTLWGSTR